MITNHLSKCENIDCFTLYINKYTNNITIKLINNSNVEFNNDNIANVNLSDVEIESNFCTGPLAEYNNLFKTYDRSCFFIYKYMKILAQLNLKVNLNNQINYLASINQHWIINC